MPNFGGDSLLNIGDIVFVRGEFANIVDDAIKVGETILNKTPFAKNYTHCAVYMGGNRVAEAQGLRKSGYGRIGQYAGNYDIGHIDITQEQRTLFLHALNEENGLPYDWLGIFWLIVFILTFKLYKRKYREHRRRYCSKYIGWALWRAGITVNDRTPEDLALDLNVTIEKGSVSA
jgi:hypothetical protein